MTVIELVSRIDSGDISLVPEVVSRYDAVHNTTSRVIVSTVSNDLIEMEKRAALLREENEQRERKILLDLKACEVRKEECKVRREEAETEHVSLSNKERALALTKQESEQKMQLEDAFIEKKRRKLRLLEEARTDVHTYIAIKDELEGPASERHPEISYMRNRDISTLSRELGFKRVKNARLSDIGKKVLKEYHTRYPEEVAPRQVEKLCNGGLRKVYVYEEKDYDWIKAILRRELSVVVKR